MVRIGKPISATGLEHSDTDRLRKTVRDAVVRLRGGEGRTSYLAGEVALDDVVGTQSTLSP